MEPLKFYHVYTRANGSENLFRNEENFRYFLKRYDAYIPPVADTLAWCLMPNHLHLLVRVKSEAELKKSFLSKDLTGLSRAVKQDLSGLEQRTILPFSHLFNAYTKAYNKVYRRRGSLFTRAFKRKEITSDSYFTRIIQYIHRNPVHHGFANNIKDWPWSSYHDFLLPELTPLQKEVMDWFGTRQQFILFHEQTLGAIPELTDHD
jgi:REP element-mobilizing transposase RayT